MPGDFIVGAVVGVAAAAVASSRAVRRGFLYSMGKVLSVYDKVSEAAHDVARSAREAAAAPNGAAATGNPVGETKAAISAASSDPVGETKAAISAASSDVHSP